MMSLDMFPMASILNMSNGNTGDAEALGQLSLGDDAFHVPHKPNVLCGDFRAGALFATVLVSPSFVLAVINIVLMRSRKDMIGVHASRVITRMARKLRRVFSMRQEVRVAMGIDELSIYVNSTVSGLCFLVRGFPTRPKIRGDHWPSGDAYPEPNWWCAGILAGTSRPPASGVMPPRR